MNVLIYMAERILKIWLVDGSSDGQMILGCPGGHNVITSILIRERQQGQTERKM